MFCFTFSTCVLTALSPQCFTQSSHDGKLDKPRIGMYSNVHEFAKHWNSIHGKKSLGGRYGSPDVAFDSNTTVLLASAGKLGDVDSMKVFMISVSSHLFVFYSFDFLQTTGESSSADFPYCMSVVLGKFDSVHVYVMRRVHIRDKPSFEHTVKLKPNLPVDDWLNK